MDKTIDVRIRAQTDELKSGLNQAASATEQAAQRMRQTVSAATLGMQNTMQQASSKIAISGASMGASMKLATESIKTSIASMGGAFSGLFMQLAKTPGAFAVLGASIGGLWMIKKAVRDTIEFTEASMDLGRALGISASKASIFKLAADDLGFSQGELEAASKGLTRQLRTNEAAMNKMGLETRDSNGQFKSLDVLLTGGISLLQNYKEGTDRNIAAQTLFGRGISASSKLMLLNQQQFKEMETLARELGLEVGERSVDAWHKMDNAMDSVNRLFKAIFRIVGASLIPVLTDLANLLKDVLPAAIFVLRNAFAVLMTAIYAVGAGVIAIWKDISAFATGTVNIIKALGGASVSLIKGDFSQASKIMRDTLELNKNAWAKNLSEVGAMNAHAHQRIAALWARDPSITSKPAGSLSASGKSDKGGEPSNAGGGLVATWEGELARMKLTFDEMKNIEGQFQAYSMDKERDFWQAKLALTQNGTETNIAVRKKISEITKNLNDQEFQAEIKQLNHQLAEAKNNEAKKLAIIEEEVALTLKAYGEGSKEYEAVEAKRVIIAQKAADQRLAIEKKAIDLAIAYKNAQINADESNAELEHELLLTSQNELLAQKVIFEQKRYDIAYQAAQDRLGIIDPDKDPVAYAEQAGAIQQIEMDHQAKMQALKNQLQLEKNKPEIAIFSQMETSFESAIMGMLTRAESFAAALSNIFKSIYNVFAQEMIAKPLAADVMKFMRQSTLYKMIAGIQVAEQVKASGATVAAKTAETTAVVTQNAAQGASGVFAALAAIPLIGPYLAPAAALAAMAFVMGLLGGGGGGGSTTTTREVPSAAGGFDIPDGVNPVTQLHEKEMVLPAEHADTIRNLKGSNVAFEALNIHITTMDSVGVKEFLLNNKMALADSLKSALRDFKA